MSDMSAVSVRNVSKRYGRNAPTLVDLDLEVEPATIVTLAGSNGSGKSTLLRCIGGLARFTGSIDVCGVPVDSKGAFRRLVGYLPQSVMLPPHATVAEAIRFFARLRGADLSELPVDPEFLPPFGARIGTLSGGQRQRVALTIALLGEPEVILLDEPVANLDSGGREAVWELLIALRETGTTTLIASPSPIDLAGIGDRTVLLDEGRIIDDRKQDRSQDRSPDHTEARR